MDRTLTANVRARYRPQGFTGLRPGWTRETRAESFERRVARRWRRAADDWLRDLAARSQQEESASFSERRVAPVGDEEPVDVGASSVSEDASLLASRVQARVAPTSPSRRLSHESPHASEVDRGPPLGETEEHSGVQVRSGAGAKAGDLDGPHEREARTRGPTSSTDSGRPRRPIGSLVSWSSSLAPRRASTSPGGGPQAPGEAAGGFLEGDSRGLPFPTGSNSEALLAEADFWAQVARRIDVHLAERRRLEQASEEWGRTEF